MRPDPLLDLLTPDDSVVRTSLDQTIRAVRRRRRVRTAARSAWAAGVVLLLALGWFRRPSAPSEAVAQISKPAALEVQTLSLPVGETVSTLPAPSGLWVTSEPASVVWITTDSSERVEPVDDATLLTFAPGCLALTREDHSVRVVWLCDDLLAQP